MNPQFPPSSQDPDSDAFPDLGDFEGGSATERVPDRPERFAERWARLATRLDLPAGPRLLVALSGGADSVLLTHLVAAADPPLDVVCVHVDHGLRGAESQADARFCESLCRSLGLPFHLRFAQLDPDGTDLEATAREARYRILLHEARRGTAPRMILTGHHADDALETLLMRWMRGHGLASMAGLRERTELVGSTAGDFTRDPAQAPVTVLRPLIAMRRSEVRRILKDRGLAWREDSSNDNRRFFRNRLRHGLLAQVEALGGDEGLANLESFSRAVESLEDRLASATAHLAWHKPAFAEATFAQPDQHPGGEIPRRSLVALSQPLLRRALWRLITDGVGQSPSRALLELIADDLKAGCCGRHNLPDGWHLVLRSSRVQLIPPPLPPATAEPSPIQQNLMPWAEPDSPRWLLAIPGIVTLPDGRRLSAEVERAPHLADLQRGPREVLLDADTLLEPLSIRWPESGDRFHPLGAPGSKPLRRFLSDVGIPREERHQIPLVFSAGSIVWAAGLRPADANRVRASTKRVLRLTLHPAQSRTETA